MLNTNTLGNDMNSMELSKAEIVKQPVIPQKNLNLKKKQEMLQETQKVLLASSKSKYIDEFSKENVEALTRKLLISPAESRLLTDIQIYNSSNVNKRQLSLIETEKTDTMQKGTNDFEKHSFETNVQEIFRVLLGHGSFDE